MSQSLTHLVNWSHQLLSEILSPGDYAVDLTSGNGYDTLMLAQRVGPSGRVLAFDLQTRAIKSSAELLLNKGIVVNLVERPIPFLPVGVTLAQANHADFHIWNSQKPRAIIANLGYCPGGDKAITTQPETTLSALQTGCDLLDCGGRIAVVVYPGHPGGRSEADAVDQFFIDLDEGQFEVLRLQVVSRPQSPFLLTAAKFN